MIVLYTGRRGCGKTLTMTKDALEFLADGWDIYSNIELGFEHTYLTTKEIIDIGKTDLHDCVLLIDEIQILIDSRRSARSGNLDFSYFVQQIRKRGIIILCTTQFSGTVDLRIRQHVDIVARPQYDKELQVCKVTYIDATVEDSMDLFAAPQMIEVVFDAREVFKYYDTKTIIKEAQKIKKEADIPT